MKNLKKLLGSILIAAMVAVFAVWMFLSPRPDHIVDTNGPDNYALQQITVADVVARKMGSRGSIHTSETHWNVAGFDVSSGTKYSSDKFTGVYELYSCTMFKGSDIYVYLTDFHVDEGNFAFYVVMDGKIVGEAKSDEFGTVELRIENIDKTATVEYVIAGESASFTFVAPTEW